jgi:tetratricopeptide (TPR) repeat protein
MGKSAIFGFALILQCGCVLSARDVASSAEARSHYTLALNYLQQHQSENAIRELKEALALNPHFKEARYTLGVALLDGGRSAEAVPILTKSIDESPCDAAIWANLVRAKFESGDPKAAILTVRRIVEGMPGNVQLLVTLGAMSYRYQEIQEARYLFENAAELMPDDPDIKLLLAKASLKGGEPVEAAAVLKSVPANSGKAGEISYTRGLALALLGKLEEAHAELSAALDADSLNPRYLVARAWVFQLQNRQDEAIADLVRARTADQRAPIVQYRLAVSYFLLKEYPKAVESCEAALRLSPQYDAAYLVMGRARLEEEENDAARVAFERALVLKPESALYHRELGVVLFKEGKLNDCNREIEASLKLDPKAAQSYLWRARVLVRQGDRQHAIADLETALALQPSLSIAYSELATLYQEEGQSQKATSTLARKKEADANSETAGNQHLLGDLHDLLY